MCIRDSYCNQTNGDFTAYVCDSAAMWLSSQISLGKLVNYYFDDGMMMNVADEVKGTFVAM